MPSVRPLSASSKSRRSRLAPVFDELVHYVRAAQLIAETRSVIARAQTAPNAARREGAARDLYIHTELAAQTIELLPAMTSGLRRRREVMRLGLDEIISEAAAIKPPGGVVIDAVARFRRGAR